MCLSPRSVIDDLRKPSCPVPSASRLRPRLVSARDSVPRSPYPSERPTRTRLRTPTTTLTGTAQLQIRRAGASSPTAWGCVVRRRLRRRGRSDRPLTRVVRSDCSIREPSVSRVARSRGHVAVVPFQSDTQWHECTRAVAVRPVRTSRRRTRTRWSDVDAEDIESRVVELAEQGPRPQRHRTQAP